MVFAEQTLTYRELGRAGRARLGASPAVRWAWGPRCSSGIGVERSLEMVVGIVGILEAGGAYVPLDPSYPRERLAAMIADAGAPVLLTDRASAERLAGLLDAACVVHLDAGARRLEPRRAGAPPRGGVTGEQPRLRHLHLEIHRAGPRG